MLVPAIGFFIWTLIHLAVLIVIITMIYKIYKKIVK